MEYLKTKKSHIDMGEMVEIPKPDNGTLDKWAADYTQCHDIPVTREIMLQAYLFDCAFIIGRFANNKQKTIDGCYIADDGRFNQWLSTATRQGLSNAISYILFGISSPRCGDTAEFETEHSRRVEAYKASLNV